MTDAHVEHPDPQATTSSGIAFSRRGLLAAGLGAGGVALLGIGGAAWAILGDEHAARGRKTLSHNEARFLDALTDALFPPGNALGVAGRDVDVTGVIDGWVSVMGPAERRLVASLLHMFDNWPRLSLSGMSRFSEMSFEDRVKMLDAFDESSLETRRALGQLLRALVSVVFFEDSRVQAGMGLEWGCEVPL